eukprot:262489-Pyramimonas_sp.AAC.1
MRWCVLEVAGWRWRWAVGCWMLWVGVQSWWRSECWVLDAGGRGAELEGGVLSWWRLECDRGRWRWKVSRW